MLTSILFVILTNRILISCVFCSLFSFSLCSLVILSKCLVCYSCNHRHNILLIHSLVNSFYQFYLRNFQQMLLFTPHHSQNRIFSAFCCFKCVLQTQCSYSWRSRPTFMQADFHAGMSLELPPKKQESRACFIQTALLSYFGFTSLSHLLFLKI